MSTVTLPALSTFPINLLPSPNSSNNALFPFDFINSCDTIKRSVALIESSKKVPLISSLPTFLVRTTRSSYVSINFCDIPSYTSSGDALRTSISSFKPLTKFESRLLTNLAVSFTIGESDLSASPSLCLAAFWSIPSKRIRFITLSVCSSRKIAFALSVEFVALMSNSIILSVTSLTIFEPSLFESVNNSIRLTGVSAN